MTWSEVINKELNEVYMQQLNASLRHERMTYDVYPENRDVFNAFKLTPLEEVNVVIIGQDPYHSPGLAHGLSFSVRDGNKIPPSLKNIYKELVDDVGITLPTSGDLTPWAKQGVLLLNSSLTVRKGAANSHSEIGWNKFTDNIIKILSRQKSDIVFLLWGSFAAKKAEAMGKFAIKHHILSCAHPSPFSASRGFFGCKHFSKTNEILVSLNKQPVDWQI